MKDKFWQVKNEVNSNAEILLYSPIAGQKSWFGDEVSPQEFAADLESLGGKDVTVRINCAGGDVFAANAIHNLLCSYKGKVTIIIDGLAASAATIVAMAGDKIIMPTNALFMIHNPAIGMSDYYMADDLMQVAQALKTIKASIIASYKKRCNLSDEELAELMDSETWLNADECMEKGFIDEIQGEIKAVINDKMLVMNSISYDMRSFKNAVSIKNHIENNKKIIGKDFKMTKLEAILNKLGLLEDISVSNVEPTSVKNISDDAVQNAVLTERNRVNDLEALDEKNNPAVTAIINMAKKEGKTVEEASPYINAVKNIAPMILKVPADAKIEQIIEDNLSSGVNAISPVPKIEDDELEKAKDSKSLDNMANVMNKIFGGKKNG